MNYGDIFGRVSVIPYCLINDEIYYCLFVDSNSNEITDGGGNIEEGEDFIDGAFREIREESNGLINFDNIPKNKILKSAIDCICIIEDQTKKIYNNQIIMFIQKTYDLQYINQMEKDYRLIFEEKSKNYILEGRTGTTSSLENSYMLWISESKLYNLVNFDSDSYYKHNIYLTSNHKNLILEGENRETNFFNQYEKGIFKTLIPNKQKPYYYEDKFGKIKQLTRRINTNNLRYYPQLWNNFKRILYYMYSNPNSKLTIASSYQQSPTK